MSTVISQADRVQFGEPLWHADGVLLALAYAADGTLWSVEEPGVLRQWDRDGRLLARQLLSETESLWAFGPQVELLVSAGDDLTVWDVARRCELVTLPQPSWVTAVAFHPTRRMIATGHDDGSVRLWHLAGETGTATEFLHHDQAVSALAFNADGSLLATASEDRQIALWDVQTGSLGRAFVGHTDRIPVLAWQPGSNILLSAGWDTTVRVWDITASDPTMLLNTHSDQVYTMAFSPDGGLLAVADSSGAVRIWIEIARGKELWVLSHDMVEIASVAFSPDGQFLAVGGNDRVIRVWHARTGNLVAGQSATIDHSIGLSLAEPALLVSNRGGTGLQVWIPHSADEFSLAGKISKPLAVACSPDGRWLAVTNADPDSRLHVWDNRTGQFRPPAEGPRAPMTFATFSPDSQTLATCCRTDGTAWLWNPADGEPKLIIPGAAEGCTVEAVAFHPNGSWLACGGIDYLATSGADGAVTIWDVVSRERAATLVGGATALAFDSAGRWLAVVSPASTIRVWDVAARHVVHEIPLAGVGVRAVAFSPDGTVLAAGSDDHTIRLWDSRSGRSLSVRELDTPIRALAFSPDGRTLYTGNGNTTCYAVAVASLLES